MESNNKNQPRTVRQSDAPSVFPQGLFRDEVFDRFRRSPWQPPLLSKPISGLTLAVSSLLVTLTMVIFAGNFSFAQKQTATGYLTPVQGWISVSAQSTAVILECKVSEGDLVQRGQVLFELNSNQGLGEGISVGSKLLEDIAVRRGLLNTQLATLKAQYENDRALETSQLKALMDQMSHFRSEIESHTRRLEIAENEHAKGRSLVAQDILSDTDLLRLADGVEARRATVLASKRELTSAQSMHESSQRKLTHLELDRKEREAEIQDRLLALAMEESIIRAREEAKVLAPKRGRIASIGVEEGDWVTAGDRLLDILPSEGQLKVRMIVDAAAVGDVEIGQEARVYLDAFPYEQYGVQLGRISSISETSLDIDDSFVGTQISGQTRAKAFQVDVEFPEGFSLEESERRALRPGMTVSVDVIRDYGTLIDWALRPFRRTIKRI